VSRWENAPSLREVVRMTDALVDLYCASYARPPTAVTLDIDDTPDIVHGHQQLALFNSHYGERGFLPIHVYDTATGRPVAVLLRPGKTPSGAEIRGHLRRLVRRIRLHWPNTRLIIRGDSHDTSLWRAERACRQHEGRFDLRSLDDACGALGCRQVKRSRPTWYEHQVNHTGNAGCFRRSMWRCIHHDQVNAFGLRSVQHARQVGYGDGGNHRRLGLARVAPDGGGLLRVGVHN
jgi:hypothetical protein